ncbi:hypothetical protein NEOC65_000242 [Neochlamydia sp. AcF65]|nr:hypothetical protein [Neochlamydia sp. AcF65]MBS4170914.1 hypothetical protein [Neochlamydia sp. AcF95]
MITCYRIFEENLQVKNKTNFFVLNKTDRNNSFIIYYN